MADRFWMCDLCQCIFSEAFWIFTGSIKSRKWEAQYLFNRRYLWNQKEYNQADGQYFDPADREYGNTLCRFTLLNTRLFALTAARRKTTSHWNLGIQFQQHKPTQESCSNIWNCRSLTKKSSVTASPIHHLNRGPGLDMYAHNSGEGNSTVIGWYDPKEQLGMCPKISIRGEQPENDHALFIRSATFDIAVSSKLLELQIFWGAQIFQNCHV